MRTPDVYLQLVCIHSDDPARCWRCADMRAELGVLAVLAGAGAPLGVAEIAARTRDPDPWWHGQTCGALLRLRGAGRVRLSGGRFSVVVNEGGKGGGIDLERDLTLGIDARVGPGLAARTAGGGCSRSRRCENS